MAGQGLGKLGPPADLACRRPEQRHVRTAADSGRSKSRRRLTQAAADLCRRQAGGRGTAEPVGTDPGRAALGRAALGRAKSGAGPPATRIQSGRRIAQVRTHAKSESPRQVRAAPGAGHTKPRSRQARATTSPDRGRSGGTAKSAAPWAPTAADSGYGQFTRRQIQASSDLRRDRVRTAAESGPDFRPDSRTAGVPSGHRRFDCLVWS